MVNQPNLVTGNYTTKKKKNYKNTYLSRYSNFLSSWNRCEFLRLIELRHRVTHRSAVVTYSFECDQSSLSTNNVNRNVDLYKIVL